MVFSTICCTFAPETSSFHLKMVFHSISLIARKCPGFSVENPFFVTWLLYANATNATNATRNISTFNTFSNKEEKLYYYYNYINILL